MFYLSWNRRTRVWFCAITLLSLFIVGASIALSLNLVATDDSDTSSSQSLSSFAHPNSFAKSLVPFETFILGAFLLVATRTFVTAYARELVVIRVDSMISGSIRAPPGMRNLPIISLSSQP